MQGLVALPSAAEAAEHGVELVLATTCHESACLLFVNSPYLMTRSWSCC
jgi:hypothetical protein